MSRAPVATELPEQGPHLRALERLALVAGVVEEPAAGLRSELVPRHLLLDQPRGPEAIVAEGRRQEPAGAVQDVHAAPVDELEDSDRRIAPSQAGLERAVDVLGYRHALLASGQRLVHEPPLHPTSDE